MCSEQTLSIISDISRVALRHHRIIHIRRNKSKAARTYFSDQQKEVNQAVKICPRQIGYCLNSPL